MYQLSLKCFTASCCKTPDAEPKNYIDLNYYPSHKDFLFIMNTCQYDLNNIQLTLPNIW